MAQAFQTAEAYLNRAVGRLSSSSSWTGETVSLSGGGTVTVTVTAATDQICPTADGKSIAVLAKVRVRGGFATVELRAMANRVAYPFRFAAFATIPNTVVTDTRVEKELWLDHQVTVDSFDSTIGAYSTTGTGFNKGYHGHVGANGDITMESGTVVDGDIRAGDAVTGIGNVTQRGVNKAVATGLGPNLTSVGEPFVSVTPPTTPSSGLNLTSGNWYFGGGNYYYTTLDLSNTVRLSAASATTVYVTGAVTIGTDVTLGNSSNPQLLKLVLKSTGANTDFTTFTAGDRFTFYGGLYGKNTNVNIGKDSSIYGSVIGRTVWLDDRTAVHYDQSLALQPVCHTGNYRIRKGSWREVLPST
jgi:hypothetical protein